MGKSVAFLCLASHGGKPSEVTGVLFQSSEELHMTETGPERDGSGRQRLLAAGRRHTALGGLGTHWGSEGDWGAHGSPPPPAAPAGSPQRPGAAVSFLSSCPAAPSCHPVNGQSALRTQVQAQPWGRSVSRCCVLGVTLLQGAQWSRVAAPFFPGQVSTHLLTTNITEGPCLHQRLHRGPGLPSRLHLKLASLVEKTVPHPESLDSLVPVARQHECLIPSH